MEFKIAHYKESEDDVSVDGKMIFPALDCWSWRLEMADGEVVCSGPRSFATEKACRSQIASAKKSMKGAMRCKVVTVDGS